MAIADDNHIYYLAQKYTGESTLAFQQAKNWTAKLTQMGKNVFSPIIHSHPTAMRMLEMGIDINGIDWVKNDLKFCECFLQNDGKICYSAQGPFVFWDSRFIMLFADSCWKDITRPINVDQHNWASTGAWREYRWGWTKYARRLLLTEFLEGKIVDVK